MINILLFFIMLVFTTCWGKAPKEAQTQKDQHIPTIFIDDSMGFNSFLNRFFSDSTFQIVNTYFPTEGGIHMCDSSYLMTVDNWFFIDPEIFQIQKGLDSLETESTMQKVTIRIIRKEIGLITEMRFERIGYDWKLTYFFINAC